MWFVRLGPSGSEEALEPVSNPVWQQRRKPLRCPAFSLVHGFLHHRGAGLLHHRQPHRTHEWQRLPRCGRLHLKVGQPLRLTATPPPPKPCSPHHHLKKCSMFGAPWQPGKLPLPIDTMLEAMSLEKDFLPRHSPTWRKLSPVCHRDTGPLTVLYGEHTTIPALGFVHYLQPNCFSWTKMHSDNHSLVAIFPPDKIVSKWINLNCLTVLFGVMLCTKAFDYTVNSFDMVSAKTKNSLPASFIFLYSVQNQNEDRMCNRCIIIY